MKMQKYLLKYIPGRFFIKGIIISIFASNLSLVNKFLIYMYIYIYIYTYIPWNFILSLVAFLITKSF